MTGLQTLIGSHRRLAVVVACLLAWCGLNAIPLPGLAADAVQRQLNGYPLFAISVGSFGVKAIVVSTMALYLLGSCSARARVILGESQSVRYQLWTAGLVLVFATSGAAGTVRLLISNGQ